jgi:hypothetical protein
LKVSLAAIRDVINNSYDENIGGKLLFSLESILLINSKMCRAATTQTQNGTYYLPAIFKELIPLNSIQSKIKVFSKAFNEININSNKLSISTQSAINLNNISNNSIDYIFTDPPYGGKVQYGELNFIWESWLNFDTKWHDEEIIVNEFRGISKLDWTNMMRDSMTECFRVLKPGRWISLCYHDTSEGTWAIIQDIMSEAGFKSDSSESALFIDTGQKSYNQIVADKVNKRDLVINFRKPLPGEINSELIITGDEDTHNFNEKVTTIIREYLLAHPGATKDRIFDQLVSRMVRMGQMEEHDFETFLTCIAETTNEIGDQSSKHWYLKETQLEIIDKAESEKEEDAAKKIGNFIANQLRNNPEMGGVHYSDIFECYIYSVKNKPRRYIVEWLPDYFYKTNEGTYRLPLNEEEELIKKEGRVKGTNRHIKRYIAFLEQEVSIREKDRPSDATLAEWIRHCRRSGMYEQGKLLYERGGITFDNLTDEQQVDVEENYQACIRALDRIGSSSEKKRGRKSKK